MIYIFRKEMRKWKTVLWVVLASLALSTFGAIMLRQKSQSELEVATVNGRPVYFDEYRRSLIEINERINSLRPLAKAYGMSEEMFLSTFLGVTKPEELALDTCIREKIIDYVKNEFKITLDSAWFKNELIKSMPQLTDQEGHINMDLYNQYLNRLSTTPRDYEKRRQDDFKRDLVQRFVQSTAYVPYFMVKDTFVREHTARNFKVVKIPFDSFLSKVKTEGIDDKVIKDFYNEHKENYRVNEKRKATYWELNPEEYTKKTEIDASTVRNFYDKHKGTLFRIPPKIKVRHILINLNTEKAHEKAKDLHKQLEAHPNSFAEIAKKSSQDEKTAKNGGLLDFFGKGTHSPDFEKAAFRLHNTNEISPVVKTQQGYEIIQLIDRIQAAEKPFDDVKDDITKTLKAKRSLASVRADLEKMMRDARENDKALEHFVQENGLKAKTTDWLTSESIKEAGVMGPIAQRLFSAHKRHASTGYFTHENRYILYQIATIEKSYIPTLDKVEEEVRRDLLGKKAEIFGKKSIKEARAALLAKEINLEQISEKYHGQLITTSKGTKEVNIKEVGDDRILREKLFSLSDQAQVLEYKGKKDYYLAQIYESDTPDLAALDQERMKIIKQEKYKTGSLVSSAFIASLHRNAKIVRDDKLLAGQRLDLKD